MSVSLIGCGHWGKNLFRNFYDLGELDFFSDVRDETAKAFSEKFGVKCLSQKEILNSDSAAIAIATPANTHYKLAKKSLLSGKHIFVEKPLAMSVREVDDLINISSKKNLHIMVGHLLHYHPAFIKLKDLLKDSKIGKIQNIYSSRLSFGKIRNNENVLWSFAPHDVSMILSVVNSEIDDIKCIGSSFLQKDIEDVCTVFLNFKNSIQAKINLSWISPYKEQKLVIIGEKGIIEFNDILPWKEKLSVIEFPDANLLEKLLEAKKSFIKLSEEEPLKKECKYFIDLISGKESPKTDASESRRVIEVLSTANNHLKSI